MFSYFRLLSAASRSRTPSKPCPVLPRRGLFPWDGSWLRPAPRRRPESQAPLALIITSPRRMPWVG